jgi:hypothetical protein
MENNRLYRFDKENIELKPVSRIKQFLYENTFSLVFIVFFAMLFLWISDSIKQNKTIIDLETQVEILTRTVEMEEESDTLHIRIAQATLEGKKNIPFNDSIVFAYIVSCKAWYPDIIMAQYKIESTSGTSDVAKNANNFFGMRPVSGKRKHYTTQRHDDSYCGYAVYDNWKLSILDKILWEHFRFNGVKPDKETYLKAHLNYAEADEYLKVVKKVAAKYTNH